MGAFHVKGALDPVVRVEEDEDLRRWVLLQDRVLVHAVAHALGAEALKNLVAHFTNQRAWLLAAKVEWASAALVGESVYDAPSSKAALSLIREHGLEDHDAQQLELVSAANPYMTPKSSYLCFYSLRTFCCHFGGRLKKEPRERSL